MPRFAKGNLTISDLKKKIKSFNGGNGNPYVLIEESSKILKDLTKIDVDFENVDYIGRFRMPGTKDLNKFEMLNGIPIAWCAAGGDWQLPLVFVLYIGDKGELRAYIPSKGNAFDHKNKCAYEQDGPFYKFNADELRADVTNRIQIK